MSAIKYECWMPERFDVYIQDIGEEIYPSQLNDEPIGHLLDKFLRDGWRILHTGQTTQGGLNVYLEYILGPGKKFEPLIVRVFEWHD